MADLHCPRQHAYHHLQRRRRYRLPGSQLVDQDSTYDLPTPTRSNAAFLGWHTNQGREMVTNGTAMKSTYGHTLVAYWDTTGHSITKTDSYRNNFRDVSSSAWYYDNVAAVYEYGLMNGTESDEFSPNDQVSMAQTVTLAARRESSTSPETAPSPAAPRGTSPTWTMP